MKKSTLLLLVLLLSCNSKDKYDPAKYYNPEEQLATLSGIVTYIFSAPPYTKMEDRFKPEHKEFYREVGKKLFKLDELFIDKKDRHYYLVIRPGSRLDQKRAAGGYFDITDDKQFKNFRETFVTPTLADSMAIARGRFLFDQMVNHDLDRFLKMGTYVQWPNRISYYDSTTYEWKMDVSLADQLDSVKMDSIRVNP